MVSWANESQRVAYQLPAAAVIAALHSDADAGLSRSEALARLARDGPNALEAEPPTPAWRRLLAQFQDTLVILLLIATAISIGLWAYERDTALPYEGLVILIRRIVRASHPAAAAAASMPAGAQAPSAPARRHSTGTARRQGSDNARWWFGNGLQQALHAMRTALIAQSPTSRTGQGV